MINRKPIIASLSSIAKGLALGALGLNVVLYLVNLDFLVFLLLPILVILFPLWAMMIVHLWRLSVAIHGRINKPSTNTSEQPNIYSFKVFRYGLMLVFATLLPFIITSNQTFIPYSEEDASIFYAGFLNFTSVCFFYYWVVEPLGEMIAQPKSEVSS